MMLFKIKNFNTINEANIEIQENAIKIINLIGLNGSGKTNVLKAIEAFCSQKINLKDQRPNLVASEIDWNIWKIEQVKQIEELISENKMNRSITYEKKISNEIRESILNLSKRMQLNQDDYANLISEDEIFKISIIKIDDSYSYIYNEMESILLPFSYFLLYATKHINKKYKESMPVINLFTKVELTNKISNELTNEYGEYFYNFLETNLIDKIKNKNGINSEQKSELINMIEQIKLIETFYNLEQLPNFKFIKNSAEEMALDYEYDIKILNDERDPKFNSIVSFYKSVGNNVFELVKETANEFKKDRNVQDYKKIDRNKERIKTLCSKSYEDIFKQNDIYAKPNFHFDGSVLKITVSTIKKFLINIDDDTKLNSDGYKAILWLIINLRKFIYEASQHQDKEYILLSDEIEKNIHPLAQIKFIQYMLNEIKEINNLKIFLSTHSPFLITTAKEISNNVVIRNEYGFSLLIPKKDIENQITEDNLVIKVYETLIENELFKKFFNKPIEQKNINPLSPRQITKDAE